MWMCFCRDTTIRGDQWTKAWTMGHTVSIIGPCNRWGLSAVPFCSSCAHGSNSNFLLFQGCVNEERYHEWAQNTNWDLSRGKCGLPVKLQVFIVNTVSQKFLSMTDATRKSIKDRVNEYLRSPRKSGHACSPLCKEVGTLACLLQYVLQAMLWRNLHGAFTVRCHFKSAWAIRKEEIKRARSVLWGGTIGWRDSLIVCAVLQKFCLFSAFVVYKVFNSIIGVIALDRGCFCLGPRPLWIAWISSNIVAKL